MEVSQPASINNKLIHSYAKLGMGKGLRSNLHWGGTGVAKGIKSELQLGGGLWRRAVNRVVN